MERRSEPTPDDRENLFAKCDWFTLRTALESAFTGRLGRARMEMEMAGQETRFMAFLQTALACIQELRGERMRVMESLYAVFIENIAQSKNKTALIDILGDDER